MSVTIANINYSDSNDSSDGDLLWLPHFFLAILLIVLTVISFLLYRRKNKNKVDKTLPQKDNKKYKITMQQDGLMPAHVDVPKIIVESQSQLVSDYLFIMDTVK